MSPRCVPESTIDEVLREFLSERARELPEEDFRLYRHVIFFLELCMENHGHRNLEDEDRARYECLSRDLEGSFRFFELFGPELLLPELDFFVETFLERDVLTSDRVVRRAKEVVRKLRDWMRRKGHLSESFLEADEARARRRETLKFRLRRLARLLSKCAISADVAALPEEDIVDRDHHAISRVEPGRLWLRVYRSAIAEEIGPVLIPEEVSRYLRPGWSLDGSLGRMRGRWYFLELDEVHPRD